MDCENAQEVILSRAEPGALPPAVAEHVAACSGCSEFLSDTQMIAEALGEGPRERAPESLRAAVLERYDAIFPPEVGLRRPLVWAPLRVAFAAAAIVIVIVLWRGGVGTEPGDGVRILRAQTIISMEGNL